MVRVRGYEVPIREKNEDVDFPAISKENLAMEIRGERVRELASSEMLRKDDLIRWGIFYEQMQHQYMLPQWPAPTPYAKAYFGNVQQRDVLWPIPSYELVVNRKLKQNPGW